MRLLSSSMFGLLLVCTACAGDSFQAGNDNASGGPSGGESGSGGAGSGGESPEGGASGTGEAGNAGSKGGSAGNAGDGGEAGTSPEGGSAGDGGTSGEAGNGGEAGEAGSAGDGGEGGSAGTGGEAGEGGSAGTGGEAGEGGSAGTGGEAGSAGEGGNAGNAGSGGNATCGDGIRNSVDEQCDGSDQGQYVCESSGALACSASCKILFSTCGADDCGPANVFQAGAAWPSRRRCVTNAGRSAVSSARQKEQNWELTLLQGNTPLSVSTAPLINAANEIIIPTNTGILKHVNSSNTQHGESHLGSSISNTFTIATNGDLMFISDTGLSQFTITNSNFSNTQQLAHGHSLLLLPIENTVQGHVICTTDKHCYVKKGASFFDVTMQGISTRPLSMAPNGRVLVPTSAGLECINLNEKNATTIFSITGPSSFVLTPTVRGDGQLFASGRNLNNVAFITARDGEDFTNELWTLTFNPAQSVTSFVLDPFGRPYVAIGKIWQRLTPKGASLIEYTAPTTLLDVSIFGGDGTAYLGTEGGDLLAVRNGQLLWSDTMPQGELVAGIAIDSQGRLIVVGTNGTLRQYAKN